MLGISTILRSPNLIWTNRLELLEASDASFRDLLQITSKQDMAQLEEDWLEIDLFWIARSVLGLGMVLQANGDEKQSQGCFDLLEAPEVGKNIRASLALWRLNSYLFANQFENASGWLLDSRSSGNSGITNMAIWMHAIDAFSTPPTYATKPNHEQLTKQIVKQAVIDLVRANQLSLIEKLVEEKKAHD